MDTAAPASAERGDYDYIIKVIQYLEFRQGIVFFITTRDFHILYRWWEKRIPLRIIEESFNSVIQRWKKKRKKIHSFSNFYHEVKKNFKAFLELDVGAETREENVNGYEVIENFFDNYPAELLGIKAEFEQTFEKLKNAQDFCLDLLYEKLLVLFADDRDLDLKVDIFRKNLAPELRKPEIEKKYRLNYLLSRFNIPDFDLYREF